MKRIILAILSLILVFLGVNPVFSKEQPRNFNKNSSEFIREATAIMQHNWQGNYFSSIEMTIGQNSLTIDGKEIPCEPAEIKNGKLSLPMAAIAEAIKHPSQENKSRASKNETEQALNVNIHKHGNKITITKPFQRKELVVQTTNESKLGDTFGAIHAVDNGYGLHLLQYASEMDTEKALDILLKENYIAYAEPNVVIYANFVKPAYVTQTPVLSNRWGAERIAADRFKDYLLANNKTQTELLVAVLDTGVDPEHPFLKNRLKTELGYNFLANNEDTFDDDGHGTHVIGTIVDCTPSNIKIMPIKVLDDEGYGTALQARFGMEYAADNGAKVLNLSFGTSIPNDRQTMQAGVDYAISRGAVCIASVGNDAQCAHDSYPGSFSNVISVSAIDEEDQPAWFTNYGEGIVDIAAPGVDILSSVPGGNYGNGRGTSMAVAFVSAAAAMLKLDDMDATPEPLKTAVKNTAADFGHPAYYGAGILDFNVFFENIEKDMQVENFITRLYRNVLLREPEPDGLEFWSNGLKEGSIDAADAIDGFFFSTEFLSLDMSDYVFIEIAYQTFMGREPDEEGFESWLHTLQEGYSRRYMLECMITSVEFASICKDYGIHVGPVTGVEGFVARMYRNVLGRRYDQDGLNSWVASLLSGYGTGAYIVDSFFFSWEFLDRDVSNEIFIEIMYQTLMCREPDEAGLAYWLGMLNTGTDRSYVLSCVVDSAEFNDICASYGIAVRQPLGLEDAEIFMAFDIPMM